MGGGIGREISSGLPYVIQLPALHRRAVEGTVVCHGLWVELWLSDTKNSPPGHLYGLQRGAGFCVDKRNL